MEGAATSNELGYIYIYDDVDTQILREQNRANFNEPWTPPNPRVGRQDGSSRHANILNRRASTMHQGVRDPSRCNLSNRNPSTSEQGPRVAVSQRIRSGIASRSAFKFSQNCKSPSTDSTTSLAQLRDKLTVLSPLKYNKVNPKIASSPALPVLKEAEEFENLSSTLPKTKRCGAVSLKSHSDSETYAKIIRNKTRPLPTVVEEHSASLVLVAALNNTNDTVTNETFEELYRNNPNIDLVDLLVEEALQHGQDKDSGIISGKVTQDTDVVENTPVEYVRRKKLSLRQNTKTIEQDAPAIDDDEVEIIEDTPCYVYDRKERVRAKSTKVSNIDTDAIVELDATIVEEFFSQHVNKNNTENIISPSLARQINATSSEASNDECIIIEDNDDNDISVTNLAFEADIFDCVNSIVDKVCSDLDKCADLLGQQERQIGNLRFAKNIDNNSNIRSNIFKTSKDMNRKLKAQNDKNICEDNPEATKKVTLKFNQSVKAAPKMSTRTKTVNNDKDRIDTGKSNVLTESTNTTPPANSTSTLIQKRRKLYSPKDDENENNEITKPKTTAEHRKSNVNQTPIATCYRELENARKSHNKTPEKTRARTQAKKSSKRTRYSAYSDAEDPPFQVRQRRSTSSTGSTTTMSRRETTVNPTVNYTDYSAWPTSSEDDEHNITIKPKTVKKNKARRGKVERTLRNQPVLSPKTRKLNEIFDKIKENIVNDEKITIVEKRSLRKDLSLYNLSSESEDGAFKKKKIQVQKRVSSSSIDSSATKLRKLSRVKYSENSSEDEGKRTLKAKTAKRGKPRSRKTNKIPKLILSDERMRVEQQEDLNTSFVKEKADANNLEVPEPALRQAPVLEVMPPDKSNDDVLEAEVLENKRDPPKKLDISKTKKENNPSKKTPKVTVTKSKENVKDLSKEKDSATVSPLPGLVVETERTRTDDLPCSMEDNLLQKLKKIYTEDQYLNEEDDTRNMLLNADENDNAVCEPVLITHSDVQSEKSIATVGCSPITGHNDLNESPPNVELLDEDFQHRDVHNEGMSPSIAEFLVNMRHELRISRSTASQTSAVIPITRTSTKESAQSNLCAKKLPSGGSVNKSISNAESNKSNSKVVLTKMPTPEIESKTDLVGTPKSKGSAVLVGTPKSKVSVVLTRMSSNEIEKYLTPSRTRKSSNTSPEVVLERISSDEINKWLPMPEYKSKESEEKAKKYNTTRTSKPPQINISPNVAENKTRPYISPVKLTFDIVDLTADKRVTRERTQSSTKSMNSRTNTNKEPLKKVDTESSKAKTSKNDQRSADLLKGSQETVTTVPTKSKPDQTQRRPLWMDISDMNKSIASVQDWFKRNATCSSPSAAEKNTVQEMLSRVLECLDTTLAEIHHDTGERLAAVFLKDQEDIARIEKEMQRVQEMIATLKKEKKKRACEVIRIDTEKKARMTKLLREDIQGLLQSE